MGGRGWVIDYGIDEGLWEELDAPPEDKSQVVPYLPGTMMNVEDAHARLVLTAEGRRRIKFRMGQKWKHLPRSTK
jgi:hypothetical protein